MLVDRLDRAIDGEEPISPRPSRSGNEAQQSINVWLFGDKGRTVRSCECSGWAERSFWFKPRVARQKAECRLDAMSFRASAGKGEVMPTLSKLLLENGLPDLPVLLIEPHRNHRGIWRIKFNYETGEPFSMAPSQASIMASSLHEIGETELAGEIDSAMQIARR